VFKTFSLQNKKMESVLQVMDYAAPYEGNFIPSIKNLEEHLKGIGVRLIYMFPTSAEKIEWVKQLIKQGKAVYFINSSFFSKKVKYSNIKYLNRIIRNEEVSIIHTHFVAYNYTLVIMKYLFLHKVRVIGNFMNEFHPPLNKYRGIKIFITKVSFDLIIGSSEAVVQSLINAGVSETKIKHADNALDVYHLQNKEKITLRENPEQTVVLMFGWPYYRKGIDIGIRAIRDLVTEGGDFLLLIALAGPSSLISDEIVGDFGEIPSFVRFLSPRNDASGFYEAADIFLSASREEGLAYSVLEAAYCSPLLVVSAIGGHAQDIPFIEIYEVEDTETLKNQLKVLSNLPVERKLEIKKTQREYVLRKYDINNWSESVMKCYWS
jgi:glycosyltransferase involved in cell wall biosynthesis